MVDTCSCTALMIRSGVWPALTHLCYGEEGRGGGGRKGKGGEGDIINSSNSGNSGSGGGGDRSLSYCYYNCYFLTGLQLL